MNELKLKQEVLRDWTDVVFVSRECWLDCLVYQETRNHYKNWLNETPAAVLYVIYYDGQYSMGARYAVGKEAYLSPYGDQQRIMNLYCGIKHDQ